MAFNNDVPTRSALSGPSYGSLPLSQGNLQRKEEFFAIGPQWLGGKGLAAQADIPIRTDEHHSSLSHAVALMQQVVGVVEDTGVLLCPLLLATRFPWQASLAISQRLGWRFSR